MRKLTCDSCGAALDIEPGMRSAVCPYCGTKLIIEEDKEVVLERMRREERNAAASKREQQKLDALEQEASRRYKRSVTTFFTIIFTVICGFAALFEFDDGNIVKGFTAVAQVILLVVSWLMGTRYIKTRNYGTYRIPKVIALLLIFVILSDAGIHSRSVVNELTAEEIVWSDLAMGDILPEPDDLTKGTVKYNYDSSLDIDYYNVTKVQFNAYVRKCKEAGFTVDISGYDTSFYAYNEDGYHLHIYYYSSQSEMQVSLDEPIQMHAIVWPTTELVSLLPQPDSMYGRIDSSSDDYFRAYFGNTTREDFNAYVNACIDAGFNVDFSQYDDYFNADDGEGHHLSVSYEGYNTIRISLYTSD